MVVRNGRQKDISATYWPHESKASVHYTHITTAAITLTILEREKRVSTL